MFSCQVLPDDKKRALYDQYGEVGLKSSVGGSSSSYTTNPFDVFETFFGPSMGGFSGLDLGSFGTRSCSTVTKGEDMRLYLEWKKNSIFLIWKHVKFALELEQ